MGNPKSNIVGPLRKKTKGGSIITIRNPEKREKKEKKLGHEKMSR